MNGRLAALVAGVVLAAAFSTAAQQSATITLRSGATMSGDLIDLGAGGFTLRVNGQDREIRRDEVRTIDFGGDVLGVPPDARTLSGGMALVVFRNGDTIAGEFYDIGGTTPLRLTFRTATGERVFESNNVRRIYMTRVEEAAAQPPAPGTPQPQTPPTRTVSVSSTQAWTPTGITVRRGQSIRFTASGEIEFSPARHRATPAGSVDNLRDTRAPLPSAPQGALIARVGVPAALRGNAGVFLVGSQGSVNMPADGQLFLGVNDSGLDDNRGAFSVELRTGN